MLPTNTVFYTSFLIVLQLLCGGCRKWVSVLPPAGQPDAAALFSTDVSARGVLGGVYSGMATGQVFASSGATLYGGLSADELWYYPGGLPQEFARSEISPAAHGLLSTVFWQPAYRYIYVANLALEQLPGAPLDDAVKRQLAGEAHFIRALSYFYLAELFGGVPLVRHSDYRGAMLLPRTPGAQVLAQVLEDLRRAEALLPEGAGSEVRSRPTRPAATALRARLLLYEGRWAEAAEAAGSLIEGGGFQLAGRPEEVYREGSPEAIFFLELPPPYFMAPEVAAVLPLTEGTMPTYCLSEELLRAFEAGDLRKGAWTGERTYAGRRIFYPARYRAPRNGPREIYVVLRLAEQYLIRSEARARAGDLKGSLEDLNRVRGRAGLAPAFPADREQLLWAIEQERRIELGFEWGHRWGDLRRWKRADAVLRPYKGATWQLTDTLWPVPGDQIRLNGALTQNPGY